MKKILSTSILLLSLACIISAELPKPKFPLAYPGKTEILDYAKYGEFRGVDTEKYKFVIKKRTQLTKDVGEGIFPNFTAVTKDKLYKKLKKKGLLKGSQWDFAFTKHPDRDFFKWATANEEPGVRQLYIAHALKEAGHIIQAIKAYYAILVHFPGSACFSADQRFVWYVAPVAIDKITVLTRTYPELGIKLEGAYVEVKNAKDTNLQNDIVTVNPGKFVRIDPNKIKKVNLKKEKIVEKRGKGKVQLIKYKNGHWQMLVNKKPYVVKGLSYHPTKIGESPHKKETMKNWMFLDENKNKKIDAPHEAWVDKNKNNKKDKNEKPVGDFQLLKEMGCNTIRQYHESPNHKYSKKEFNKKLLRELNKKYGIKVIMGDFLGAYTIGSGADWEVGTDYTDRKQCDRMKEIVRQMVLDHKDEPYVLMWVLGNENNMDSGYKGVNASRTLAAKNPEAYARFLNEVAKMIHEIDKDHPVMVGNMLLDLIEYYNKYAPEIDIFGVNWYTDNDGFGALFERIRRKFDRPVIVTEYGCDAWDLKTKKENEEKQADWHKGAWLDIAYNFAGGMGSGNVIGGVPFEYLDEWWKSLHGDEKTRRFEHQTKKDGPMPFFDGWGHEEWLGIVSQGDGSDSPFLRQLRKSYFVYKELWNK